MLGGERTDQKQCLYTWRNFIGLLRAREWGWELPPPAQGAAVALRASLTLTHSHTLTSAVCALCCASPQPALGINEMPGTQGTAPSPTAATRIHRFGSREPPELAQKNPSLQNAGASGSSSPGRWLRGTSLGQGDGRHERAASRDRDGQGRGRGQAGWQHFANYRAVS